MNDYDNWENWRPTSIGINSLPKPLFKYIHSIETNCDPAGIIAENTLLKDEIKLITNY